MANRSSDRTSSTPAASPTVRGGRAVFIVATDPAFLDRVLRECQEAPAGVARYSNLDALSQALGQLERIQLAFVLLVEHRGADLDIPALRQLRLNFPQLVILSVLEGCDQQTELRLHSIGVQAILLPPFSRINLTREISSALPNVPNFKRHPDLMRRSNVRMDFLIPSDLSYVIGVNYQISNLLKEFGFPPQDTRVNIPLACDEAITNAIIHGNRSNPDKKVNIQVYVSPNRFRIRVRDEGEGFDVARVDDPTRGEALLRPGGRGVYLMRNIMDVVEFKENGRVVELEKRNGAANGAINGHEPAS
ncbi:MAG TPA: ATP-binding protein [Candidatus Krumholzibacteria bacterium]|nr:ATP-binding protein [Candidatus Krumholzibacteria bacterium]